MSLVRWARLEVNCGGPDCPYPSKNGGCFHNVKLVKIRKWWPVYVGPHTDPTLGENGSVLHYHVAWNRLSQKAAERAAMMMPYGCSRKFWLTVVTAVERLVTLHGWVVYAHDVVEWKDRPAPILRVGKSMTAPDLRDSTILPMIREWAQERGIPCNL